MKKWIFETASYDGNRTKYQVELDWDDDLPLLISDTMWPGENSLRLYDLDGLKKLRQILTEIENSIEEN
tara:strand:+ start:121 stop:327 length:207 start_codon:yes stop_codon:yes gene_type:complete